MRYAVIVPATFSFTECAAVGLLTRLKAAALFGCLLFTSQSFAVDYYWQRVNGPKYSSASQACKNVNLGTYNGYPVTFSHVVMHPSAPYGDCVYVWSPDKNVLWNGTVVRGGDTCPAGTGPYDNTIGDCPVARQPGEKCADQTGSSPGNPMIYDNTA